MVLVVWPMQLIVGFVSFSQKKVKVLLGQTKQKLVWNFLFNFFLSFAIGRYQKYRYRSFTSYGKY